MNLSTSDFLYIASKAFGCGFGVGFMIYCFGVFRKSCNSMLRGSGPTL